MNSYGCTTPFVPNKNAICKDQKVGRDALELYKNKFDSYNSSCLNPCRISMHTFIKTKDDLQPYIDRKRASALKIFTKEKIKVMRSHELYLWDSLLGEVGGYVGMFLGVSVLQIGEVLNKFLSWCFRN